MQPHRLRYHRSEMCERFKAAGYWHRHYKPAALRAEIASFRAMLDSMEVCLISPVHH